MTRPTIGKPDQSSITPAFPLGVERHGDDVIVQILEDEQGRWQRWRFTDTEWSEYELIPEDTED